MIDKTPDVLNACVSCGSHELRKLTNQILCPKCGLVLSDENINHLERII